MLEGVNRRASEVFERLPDGVTVAASRDAEQLLELLDALVRAVFDWRGDAGTVLVLVNHRLSKDQGLAPSSFASLMNGDRFGRIEQKGDGAGEVEI
jgi:hypothetical protein